MRNYGECEWETGVVLYEHKEKKKKSSHLDLRNEKNIKKKKIKR